MLRSDAFKSSIPQDITRVKILGRGELKSKLTVTAHKFTATAKAAIEAAGGEAVTL